MGRRPKKRKGGPAMNAQMIVDEANTSKFNPKQFRNEMNLSWLLNDVVAESKRQEELINKMEEPDETKIK